MKKFLLSLMAVIFAAVSVNADELKITEVAPADGTEMTNMPANFTVTFADDATIGYAKWQVINISKDEDALDRVLTQGQLKKGENGVWSGKAYFVEALKMYAGNNYQLLIYPYATEDDANYETSQFGGAICEMKAATWKGTTAAYQYAEAQLQTVTPSPESTIVSGEITAVFSAPVESVTATINGGIADGNAECQTTPSEDKCTWTIMIPEKVTSASTGSISMNVYAKDAEGRVVKGEYGEDAESYFVWNFNCYNANPVPASVTPANGATVEKIDTIYVEDKQGINLSYSASSDIMITKGMELICTVPADSVKIPEGELGSKPTKLTIILPSAITNPGTYQVLFPSLYFMIGEEMSSLCSKAFHVEYTIEGEEEPVKEGVAPISIEPANESTVSSLKTFTLMFPEGSYVGSDGSVTAKLYNLDREVVATCTADYDWDVYEKAYLYLNEKVVKAGTYTLIIPAGVFALDENGTVFNKEVTYTYTVDGTEDKGEEENEDAEIEIVSVDPANESTVSSLKTITLMFPEGSLVCPGTASPQLLDSEMNVIATGTVDYDWDVNEKGYIYLGDKVVKAGTYTLLIPTGAFALDLDGKTINKSAVYTYTVDGSEDSGEVTPTSYIREMALAAEGGSITFTEDIMFTGNAESVTCDIMSGETKVATAILSYDEVEYNKAVVTFDKTLDDGTYTIVFDGKISSWTTAQVLPIDPTEFTIGGSAEPTYVTDMAMYSDHGIITFCEDVMFAEEATSATCDVLKNGEKVATATLTYNAEYNKLNVDFDPALEQGATYTIDFANQVYSYLTGQVMPIEPTEFTVMETAVVENMELVDFTLNSKGGKLVFSDDTALAGGVYDLSVNVLDVEGNVVTTAKLEYDWYDYKLLLVTFADELVSGKYLLSIPQYTVASNNTGAWFEAQDIAFEIGGTGINAMASNEKVVRYTLSGQKAAANAKGILIINGKKVLVK